MTKVDEIQPEGSQIQTNLKVEVQESVTSSAIQESKIAQTIAEFFSEDMPLSQDDIYFYGCLCELLENHHKTDLARYFKTEEAR